MAGKTLAEIGYSIRNQVKGHFSSDDERIDILLVYKMMNDVRSVLIQQELRAKSIDEGFYQEVSCLEVKCGEIECKGLKSGDVEYYVDLPPLELGIAENGIKYFGGVDRVSPFNPKSFQGWQYAKYSKYTGKSPNYTIVGDKALLGNLPSTDMKFMSIIGIFEDPIDLGCYKLKEDDVYPIPAYLIHKLELICIKQLLSTINITPDEVNNTTDVPMMTVQQQRQAQAQAAAQSRRGDE